MTIYEDVTISSANERLQLIESLRNREYREAFVEESINVGLASQIRMLQHDRGWTQQDLGERTGMAQESIARLESTDYGRYSIRTLKRLAGAFDVALVVRFAPFSELIDWTISLSRGRLAPRGFADDPGIPVPSATHSSPAAAASRSSAGDLATTTAVRTRGPEVYITHGSASTDMRISSLPHAPGASQFAALGDFRVAASANASGR